MLLSGNRSTPGDLTGNKKINPLPLFVCCFLFSATTCFAVTAEEKQKMKEHFGRAEKFFGAGEYEQAIAEWNKVLKLDPDHSISKKKIKKAQELQKSAKGKEPAQKDEKKAGLKKTEGGILFSFQAPEAKSVYLAGSFNDWAKHADGNVSGEEYAMEDKNKDGIWEKVIALSPGEHKFKYVKNGSDWFPDPGIAEKDPDDNTVFRITEAGKLAIRKKNPALAPRKVEGGVLFRFDAPEAEIVYIAGSFNDWAANDGGKVTDPKYAMNDEDKDGIWEKTEPIKPGEIKFKYVVDGRQWYPDPNLEEKDGENNTVYMVR